MSKRNAKRIFIPLALALVICAVIGISLSACSEDESKLPPVTSGSVVVTPNSSIPTDVEPSIRGYITRITYSAESTELLVEYLGSADYELAFRTAKIAVDSKTATSNSSGETVSSFSVGQLVDVWTGSAAGESDPVIAYGQAVLVNLSAAPVCGVDDIPQLIAASGGNSYYMTVVSNAVQNGRDYKFGEPELLLNELLGAHLSASAGDTVSLNFTEDPDSCAVVYYEKPYSGEVELECSEGHFVIPNGLEGQFYVRVSASWGENSADYWFAVAVISA